MPMESSCGTNSECAALSDCGWSTVLGSDTEGSDRDDYEVDEGDDVEVLPSETVGFSRADTMIIFDWDDTLLPTTWLAGQGLLSDLERPVTAEQAARLELLQVRVAETLQEAMKFGEVVIITNAIDGWVQGSCERFFPELVDTVAAIRTVSARSTCESLKLHMNQWKALAFEREIDEHYASLADGRVGNVISVGDSPFEHEALIGATKGLAGCRAKSVRLAERPSLRRLADEHELISGAFEEVAQYDGDLDVDVSGARV